MKFVKKIAIAVTMLAMAGTISAADDPNEAAIEARQGAMELYSFNMGVLSAMAKGKVEYDAAAAATAATNLNLIANMDNSALWPEGSDSESSEESRAKAEIWTTYPEIAEKGKALATAATELEAVAGNGLDALKEAMGPVGKSCKGCHDDFRAKKDD